MMASDPWRRETDASTGRAYFWHPTTGEARWTLDDSESVRFDQATRARDAAKGLLHYQNRLKKAVRLVKFARIDKFRRKIDKYRRAIRDAAAPRKGPNKRKSSRFIGVTWDAARGKWMAYVMVGDKHTQIGRYDDEEVAARKYNEYVRRHDLGNPLNDVDADGKPLPTTVKRSSRFFGVYWHADRGKWRVQYYDDSEPRTMCHVGYFVDEERAALAYNKAVCDHGLESIRYINRVDPATGRPLPRD